MVTFTPPNLDEKASPTQKEMWKIYPNKTIKRQELLEANLEAMYEVVMSICDPVLKDQVCNHENNEGIDNKQDTLGLLQIIRKAMYSNGDDDNHMGCSSSYELLPHTTGKVSVTTRIQGPFFHLQECV